MDDLRFDGRVAIITGAGRGLGRTYAHALAARGARVVVNDVGASLDGRGQDHDPAERVVKEIADLGGTAIGNTDSVASREGGAAILRNALDAFGRIDIVVNNAGILRDKALHNMSPEEFDAVIDVHLRGAFFVTQPALRHMREQRYGRIITTTSPAGLYGNFGQANYGAAKLALVAFARVIAAEGAKYNVKANALAPGALTRMTEPIAGDAAPLLSPDLVAPALVVLAHDSCPVSGEVFHAVGGRVCRVFFGETPGYFDPSLTPESLLANFGSVMDEVGYTVPQGIFEAIESVVKLRS